MSWAGDEWIANEDSVLWLHKLSTFNHGNTKPRFHNYYRPGGKLTDRWAADRKAGTQENISAMQKCRRFLLLLLCEPAHRQVCVITTLFLLLFCILLHMIGLPLTKDNECQCWPVKCVMGEGLSKFKESHEANWTHSKRGVKNIIFIKIQCAIFLYWFDVWHDAWQLIVYFGPYDILSLLITVCLH